MNLTVHLAAIEDSVVSCMAVRNSIMECCVLDNGSDALVLGNGLQQAGCN